MQAPGQVATYLAYPSSRTYMEPPFSPLSRPPSLPERQQKILLFDLDNWQFSQLISHAPAHAEWLCPCYIVSESSSCLPYLGLFVTDPWGYYVPLLACITLYFPDSLSRLGSPHSFLHQCVILSYMTVDRLGNSDGPPILFPRQFMPLSPLPPPHRRSDLLSNVTLFYYPRFLSPSYDF